MLRYHLLLLLSLLVATSAGRAADISGSYSSDTTFADGDTWTSGDVTLASGATINIPAGSTVTFNSTGGSSGRNLSGTGIFAIDAGGTLLLDTNSGNDNIIVSGSLTMANAGTLRIDCGADIRLSSSTSSFHNTGLIWKTQGSDGSSNDPAYIFGNSPTAGGSFVNDGDIKVDAGHLNISGTRSASGAAVSNGGTFTVASGTILSFTGGWTLLRGTAATTGSGSVALTNEDPAGTTGGIFTAMAATTILDIGGSGLMWTTGVLDPNGKVIRNDNLLRLAGAGATVMGTGDVVNGATGTFRLQSGTLTLTDNDFTNEGAMTLETGTGTVTVAGTGSLINSAGGTFTLVSGNLAANALVQNDGLMVLDASGVIGLSGSASLTNNATGTFSLIRGTLNLAGNNVVNNGLAQFVNDGNVTLTGSGRFINNLTFNHVYGGGNDNLIVSGSAVLENNGTYDFQGSGDIQLTGTAGFENQGLLVKTSAVGDPSFVFGAPGFVAADGSEIRASAGILRLATGGASVAGATWTADGGNLDLAGEWSGVIQGNSAGSSRVRIISSGNGSVASDLLVGGGGLTLSIAGGGVSWSAQSINTQGNTIANTGVFGVVAGGTKTLSGGGEFVNAGAGTFNFSDGLITFADGTVLRNQGLLNIPVGAGSSSVEGAGAVINDGVGIIDWSGGALGITPTVTFRNDGAFNISGTGTHTLNNGGQLLNGSAGTVNWSTAVGLTIDTATVFRNEGLFNIDGAGTRSLGGAGQLVNGTGGTMHWSTNATLSIAGGTTLTNDGTFLLDGTGNRSLAGAGAFVNNGTFDFHPADSSADNLTATTSGGQFTNNGLFLMRDVSDFELRNGYTFTNAAGATLRRTPTTNLDQAQFFSFSTDTGAGTFDNQGTVEVLGGIFRVTSSATSSQFDDVTLVQNDGAGTLTGGDWVADSTATGTAQIDLDAFGNSTGITSIGAAANVELTGSGAALLQLASLSQVDGGLYINQKTFSAASGTLNIGATGSIGGNGTVTNALSVAGTVTPGDSRGAGIGTMTLGGDVLFQAGSTLLLQMAAPTGVLAGDLDPAAMRAALAAMPDQDPAAGAHDSLEVTGALTFHPSMDVKVTSTVPSFQYGQYFDLLDFAGLGIQGATDSDLPNILDLPDPGGFMWDTSLFLSHGIIFVVPEPSRFFLLAAGFILLTLRRRRTHALS